MSRSGRERCGGGLPPSLLLRSAALLLLLLVSASAQSIPKWRTPDGRLFFGDRPPAGSIRVGEIGGAARPAAPAPSKESFAAKANQSRGEMEQALRQGSDRLWEIRDQLDKVESLQPRDDPEFVMSRREATDLAAFEAKKAETLQRLRAAERRSYAAIADLWKSLDELNAKVAANYGGEPPGWWPGTPSCPNCPSRDEAEEALR